ncbi:MAG: hypothetical protein IPI20_18610 [Rhodoferax sp.]|nr:hypothetical protein [Rhodoferax sp.]
MELASPGQNRNLKLIWVGAGATGTAWRVFGRPLDSTAAVQAMDDLFAKGAVDIDLDPRDKPPPSPSRPAFGKHWWLTLARWRQAYLRARLALAGLIDVDEADAVSQAQIKLRERHYDIVLVNVDMLDDPWSLVER